MRIVELYCFRVTRKVFVRRVELVNDLTTAEQWEAFNFEFANGRDLWEVHTPKEKVERNKADLVARDLAHGIIDGYPGTKERINSLANFYGCLEGKDSDPSPFHDPPEMTDEEILDNSPANIRFSDLD